MQIIYDVNNLENQVNTLHIERERMIIVYVSIIALLAIVVLIVLIIMLKRNNELKKEAEQSSLIKTAFIRNINHEIRTPLNSIVGFSRIITEKGNTLDQATLDQYDAIINSNCDAMLQMVDDLLSVSDIESGKIKYDLKPCSMNEICDISICRDYSLSPGVEMRWQRHEQDITTVTDRARVIQVISHFLKNACKFTQKGSITLDYSISPKADKVIISVTDTGIGISKEKAENIFSKFEKIDTFTQGTGIGLNMCSLIASGLGGETKLDTSYSEGSRFLLILPVTQ